MKSLLPFALILVAFYFLIIRPQRTRLRQAQALQAQLTPGVEVMTSAGIYGTVTEVQEDSVVLQTSPGATLRVAKAAVGRILTPHDQVLGPSPAGEVEAARPGAPSETGSTDPDAGSAPGTRAVPGD